METCITTAYIPYRIYHRCKSQYVDKWGAWWRSVRYDFFLSFGRRVYHIDRLVKPDSVQGSALFSPFTVKYLFAKLNQDIVKLPHQEAIDGFSWLDVLEFQEHIECSSWRMQCLKWLINNRNGLFLNNLSRHIDVKCSGFRKKGTKWTGDSTQFPSCYILGCVDVVTPP